MAKDAMGHGSDSRGGAAEVGAAHGVKGSDWNDATSDQTYHDTMPVSNYKSQIGDLLGMWSGSQKSEALSAEEDALVTKSYNRRDDWRHVAADLHDKRTRAFG